MKPTFFLSMISNRLPRLYTGDFLTASIICVMMSSSRERFLTPQCSSFLVNSRMSILPDLSISSESQTMSISQAVISQTFIISSALVNSFLERAPSLSSSNSLKAYSGEIFALSSTRAIFENTEFSNLNTGSKASSLFFKISYSSKVYSLASFIQRSCTSASMLSRNFFWSVALSLASLALRMMQSLVRCLLSSTSLERRSYSDIGTAMRSFSYWNFSCWIARAFHSFKELIRHFVNSSQSA